MRFATLSLGILIGSILLGGASIILAWTGPTASPPNNNVAAPINVGTIDQIKDAGIGMNSLAVFGNAIISTVSGYLNFGSTVGSAGYGFRDNSGVMEFKNSGGTWVSFQAFVCGLVSCTGGGGGGGGSASTTGAIGPITQITFSDSTTQTTAYTQVSGAWCGAATADVGPFSCGNPPQGMLYTSISTCKGASVVSSCPAGYTLRSILTGKYPQGPDHYNICLRTCTKN